MAIVVQVGTLEERTAVARGQKWTDGNFSYVRGWIFLFDQVCLNSLMNVVAPTRLLIDDL